MQKYLGQINAHNYANKERDASEDERERDMDIKKSLQRNTSGIAALPDGPIMI
jgi:hypothetical protein